MYINNIYTSLGPVLFKGLFVKISISLFTLLKHKYQKILKIVIWLHYNLYIVCKHFPN